MSWLVVQRSLIRLAGRGGGSACLSATTVVGRTQLAVTVLSTVFQGHCLLVFAVFGLAGFCNVSRFGRLSDLILGF